MATREPDTQDYGQQRKSQVADFAAKKDVSRAQKPDFPEGWTASTTASGRVSRLSYEPKTPIEFAEAKGMAEAANHSLMAG